MKTIESINEDLLIKRKVGTSEYTEDKEVRKLTKEVSLLEYAKKAIETGLTDESALKQIKELERQIIVIDSRLPKGISDEGKRKIAQIKSMYCYADKKIQIKFLKFCIKE